MDGNKGAGIISIILGLIFILFPMFSSELVSVIVGVSLLFFGLGAILMGWNMRDFNGTICLIAILIGIISVIFGLLFIFSIDALSFLIGLQFYIVGFIMIIFGILGIISKEKVSIFTSLLTIIMGIIAVCLAAFSMSEPIFIAIIIGICLIIEGVEFILLD